ncbi:hypothetical protein JQC92_18015 [Shewanella sp. 202IG2-18]|uniref:hypothetical protein n=1 Tax=Parashewanella hymeniacidonis TaxID=2807618 RepID=UPI00195F7CDD|nr:hypothetical protein [Parashewanella hymeniacidonis]MBM7073905.1 hypothetical protein [Parashewanella hymeniacidonis]
MISLYQLKNKLNKQAKEFAELLEFPDLYAQGLWARGVYNCPYFSDTHKYLSEVFEKKKLDSILKHDSLKYLMINEYDDQEIIESLHKEIESMANRIESLMLVDIETLELVSVIYQVLGLPEDAKFIVNTGADFRLEWRPYFDAFDDPLTVQYADLKVHGCYFRLIACKFPFEKLSLDDIKKYMYINHVNHNGEFEGCISEGNTFSKHVHWLVLTLELFSSGKVNKAQFNPTTFKIEGMRYLVYGFPLPASLVSDWHKPELCLQVKNVDGDQKFIVRIDQQALVFYARRVDTNFFNTIDYEKYISLYKSSVLSHFDADNQLLEVDGVKYLSFVRPFCLEDSKGAQA